jgi:hypothetical protein
MGPGLLAIWNAITPEHEARFNAWYDGEHVPERLALPGFLEARRYRDAGSPHRYCALYDTDSPDALSSRAYLARLSDPTPATRSIMSEFRDMHRAVCEVTLDVGAARGAGRSLSVVELDAGATADLVRERAASLAAANGLRIRLAVPDAGRTQVPTPEQQLRGAPDRLPSTLLLIEGEDAQACLSAAAALATGISAMSFELLYATKKNAD